MLRMRFLLAFLTLLLGVFAGTSRICNDFSCRDICNVGTTCKPERMKFDKECDDDYWVDVGLVKPDPDAFCTQCCDKYCNRVQTFPRCTGERCKQCYDDGSSGNESTESYDLECCIVDRAFVCGLCSIPEGWNAEWQAELLNQLPEGTILVDGDYSCAAEPGEGCQFCEVVVVSAEASCKLSRDLGCKGYYVSEKTPACTTCIPKWNKTQLISKSFERLTVQCKEGDSAKCEKVPAGIVRIDVICDKPCVRNLKGAAARVRKLGEGPPQTFFLGFGDIGQPTNRAPDGNLAIQTTMDFSLKYDASTGLVTGTHSTLAEGSVDFEYQAVNSSSGMVVDPSTGEILDHDICELFIRAQSVPDGEAEILVDLRLAIGTDPDISLGVFSHNSADGGATVARFCRPDFREGFEFTATMAVGGTFSDSQEGSKVEIQCGTRV